MRAPKIDEPKITQDTLGEIVRAYPSNTGSCVLALATPSLTGRPLGMHVPRPPEAFYRRNCEATASLYLFLHGFYARQFAQTMWYVGVARITVSMRF